MKDAQGRAKKRNIFISSLVFKSLQVESLIKKWIGLPGTQNLLKLSIWHLLILAASVYYNET